MGQRSVVEYERYYDAKLEEGNRFEDYVAITLYRRGLVLVRFGSRRYQWEVGENLVGAEIKRDGLFRETGNLYIETAEKAHPNNERYVESGIYRSDNSWLYIIGDEQTFYVFAITILRLLNECGRYTIKQKPTSHGFLLPLKDAEKFRALRIDCDENNAGLGRDYTGGSHV